MTDLPQTGTNPVAEPGVARPTRYAGNTNDLVALGAAMSGLSICGYMASGGLFCLVPLLLGIAGFSLAKAAENPRRAKTLSLVGVGIGGCLLLFFLAMIVCYAMYFVFIMFVVFSTGQTGKFN